MKYFMRVRKIRVGLKFSASVYNTFIHKKFIQTGGIIMPVITLEAGSLTKEQKEQLAKELTASASKIMGIPEQAFVAIIRENNPDNIGVGGILLSERKK